MYGEDVMFQGVMVRLMLVLAPVMCILSGIAVSSTLTTYMKNLDSTQANKKNKRPDSSYPIKNEVILEGLCQYSKYMDVIPEHMELL